MNRPRLVKTGPRSIVFARAAQAVLASFILAGGFFATARLAEHLVAIPDQRPAVPEYSWRVAAVMPVSEDGYWREMRLSMRNAAMRFRVGLEFLGPRYLNVGQTIERFDRAIAARVDGIVCYAEDNPAIAEAIMRAGKAGIPVVTVGVDVAGSNRQGYVGPDSYSLGYEAGRTLQATLGSGRVGVVLSGEAARPSSSQSRYLRGLRSSLATQPSLRITRVICLPADPYGAERNAEHLLSGTAGLDAVCCASPRDTLLAAKVLRASAGGREAVIIGAGIHPETLQLLRRQVIQATVASYPYAMGSDAVCLLADIMAGRSHPPGIISGTQVFFPEDAAELLHQFHRKEETGG